jgi:hypothetical protein
MVTRLGHWGEADEIKVGPVGRRRISLEADAEAEAYPHSAVDSGTGRAVWRPKSDRSLWRSWAQTAASCRMGTPARLLALPHCRMKMDSIRMHMTDIIDSVNHTG